MTTVFRLRSWQIVKFASTDAEDTSLWRPDFFWNMAGTFGQLFNRKSNGDPSPFVLFKGPQSNIRAYSALACGFLLTIAWSSNHLRHLVPDYSHLLDIIIQTAERWAYPDSSAESISFLLQTIRQKNRHMRFQQK